MQAIPAQMSAPVPLATSASNALSCSEPVAALYPPIEPFETGFLNTGDGHKVYWERCGNPQGIPAVFLHGGPGDGCGPDHRRLFDPARYCLTLFDQRGCGRSTPHASLENNTTWDLVADIERLRLQFGPSRWLVFGGSWGSTLALAYALKHPQAVSALVVRGIFTLRQAELHWYYQEGASWLFPDYWEEFLAPIPAAEHGDLISAYQRRLVGTDTAEQLACARAWSLWEGRTIRLLPNAASMAKYDSDAYLLALARIENHYFVNHGWMEDGYLIRNAHKLSGIPGVIVQGRYDVCTPTRTAWDLHRAWPTAEFKLVNDAGHVFNEPGILSQLLAATDRFAQTLATV